MSNNACTHRAPEGAPVHYKGNGPAAGKAPQTLKSEEAVLAAVDSGAVTLEPTRVVLNCPIVHRGSKGALPGVSLVHPDR